MDNNNKPVIRFNGFKDSWKFDNAKHLFASISDKGHPYLPVLSATQDRGMIRRDENSINISHNKKNEEGYKRVLPGQFVIHLRSFQGGFAHSEIEGITSPAYTVFDFIKPEDHDDDYWKYVFTSKEFIKRLETVTYGIRDGKSISYDEFLSMNFDFPSKKEQTRLAEWFDVLSNLITNNQNKYDKMVNLKKAMLEKMFPKENCTVPEIRFKGFTGEWEKRKLGENIIEYTEKTTENNQYPVLTSSRKGIFFQKDYYDGNQVASADNTGYNIVPYGYFTYRHMSDDEVFHFNINDITPNGIVSTLYPVFTTDNELDSRFLQYQLNYGKEFAKFAVLQKQGGSRTYMYLNKLKKLWLTIPKSVDEQKQISSYFIKLDRLITLQQQKIEKLKNIKQALLDKMFV